MATWVDEVYREIEKDPCRANGLIDDLGLRLSKLGISHPAPVRMEVCARRRRVLYPPGTIHEIGEPELLNGEPVRVEVDVLGV